MDQKDKIVQALVDNQDFWNGWLSMRLGPMGSFFSSGPEEIKAAEALAEALKDEIPDDAHLPG